MTMTKDGTNSKNNKSNLSVAIKVDEKRSSSVIINHQRGTEHLDILRVGCARIESSPIIFASLPSVETQGWVTFSFLKST